MDKNNCNELKHRGKADKGIPKIYFCAHHDDREPYFDKIYDALSKETECSLWYDEDPFFDTDKNKRRNELEQMNLFVVPVTRRLLTCESKAITEELPIARENGTPILPLVVEKIENEDFDKLFESIFGNIQYLVLDQNTPTAICFKEKLNDYLSSVLVSPELYERIKKAFDGYELLNSHRKDGEQASPADRQSEAPEREKRSEPEHKFLMGMACFSGIDLEIDRNKALDLLEEAADAEYPEAMERLSDLYRNGIGARNAESRERQLRYVLHCKERYEREGTEKSALRFADALEAQGNLEDALMRFGQNDTIAPSRRPIPKASLLMIALLEKTNQKYKTITTKRRLIAAYDGICDRYTVTRRNGMIIDHGLSAIAILEDMAKYNYDPEIFENIAERYRTLSGEACVDAETSLEYLKKALRFYSKAKSRDRSPDTLKGYISIFDSIASCLLHRARLRHNESRVASEKLLALHEELCEKDPSFENRLALCKQYLYFASLASDPSQEPVLFSPEERVGFCNRAYELTDEIFSGDNSVSEPHLELILTRLRLTAKAYDDMESNALAAEFYLRYILSLDDLTADAQEIDKQKAEAFLKLSRVFERMGDNEKAAQSALKAVSLGTLRSEDYSGFMSEYIKKKDPHTLAAFANDGFDRYAQLIEENARTALTEAPSRSRSEFANDCCSAYELCLKNGRPEAALKYLKKCVDTCRTLAESESPKSLSRFRFKTLAMLGDLYLRFENKPSAVEAFLECVDVGLSIGDDELLMDELRLLSSVCRKLASFAEEEGELERAEKYYTFALQRLYRIYLITNQKDDLDEGLAPLSAIYKKQGNRFFAFKKKLALLKQLKKWENE